VTAEPFDIARTKELAEDHIRCSQAHMVIRADAVLKLITWVKELQAELLTVGSENRHLANSLDVQRTGRTTAESKLASIVRVIDMANEYGDLVDPEDILSIAGGAS
jgi:hypothetical protein